VGLKIDEMMTDCHCVFVERSVAINLDQLVKGV
jgi:hypothetical protein